VNEKYCPVFLGRMLAVSYPSCLWKEHEGILVITFKNKINRTIVKGTDGMYSQVLFSLNGFTLKTELTFPISNLLFLLNNDISL